MATIFNQREDLELRKQLRRQQTATEMMLWEVLRGSKLGIKFRRQFGLGPYIVDFYCPRAKLVVEVDGSIHGLNEVHESDMLRQKDIEGLGLRFLRFSTDEILNNLGAVTDVILGSIPKPSPYEGEGRVRC